jgi:hypothetical protein
METTPKKAPVAVLSDFTYIFTVDKEKMKEIEMPFHLI